MALLVEIANKKVSRVAAEKILYPGFVTGVQLDPVSRLLFISIFGVDIIFWVRLVNSFLKVRMEKSLFPPLYSRYNTLDNDTPDGINDINDNNDDDNNDHDMNDNK